MNQEPRYGRRATVGIEWCRELVYLRLALLIISVVIGLPAGLNAQTANPSAPTNSVAGSSWTTDQDHKNMMEQLSITRLRPGRSPQPGLTNSANYDPEKANPYPDLPDPLTLKNGQKVTTAAMWWQQRRPEIV